MATLRGGLRGPPTWHATLEMRTLTRDLTRAAYAPMLAKTTPFSCVAQVAGSRNPGPKHIAISGEA
eukprot:1112778-Pyramimonas_sp.AAC.1